MSEPTTANNPPPVESEARERAFELLISRLLQVGVIASLLMIVFGAALTFVHHPAYRSDPNELRALTQSNNAFPHSIPEVARGVFQLHGQSITAAGLLLLIGTPVMRVVVSIFAFAWQRDWAYTII